MELNELKELTMLCKTAPSLDEMPHRNLESKGIFGPTGAHVIEEIHTPLNFSSITLTTGTTAFQNIVGITHSELNYKIKTSEKIFDILGIKKRDKIIVTYPPLVNVFSKESFTNKGIEASFLERSNRESFIYALCTENPKVIIGESSFIKSTLIDAEKIGVLKHIPKNLIIITAGAPLELELIEVAKNLISAEVHDLYGCQEFGWLTLDGVPLREDISLLKTNNFQDLIVGGLPTGDRFPINQTGHICNPKGNIITYSAVRAEPDKEVTVLETTASSDSTIKRLCKTILRIKAKIVRVSPDLKVNSEKTVLSLSAYNENENYIIEGPEKTAMFDLLLEAQMEYQSQGKKDLTWIKRR